VQPASVEELQEVVRTQQRVRVSGGGSKLDPEDSPHVVRMTRWSGIVDYAPAECVFTARAGTPIQEITAALTAHGQYLPFDPPFADDGATIGGTVASGLSGPRRYRYGGVRDFVIGVRVIDGEGRSIRSGGKVVKNAAGFLLHHGIVGSCGRFGILTEVTCKVFPAPQARRMATVSCGSAEHAFATARKIEAARLDCEAIDFDQTGTLRITLAGREAALDARLGKLLNHLAGTVAVKFVEPPPTSVPGLPTSVPNQVKVAGLMNSWHKLRDHVDAAHFMCAGAVAWLSTSDPDRLAGALRGARLTGQIINGTRAGERIGHVAPNEFEDRVRRVLDPHDKFSAAPYSTR
jgi:glycolate oxidase FAD binding subunit